MWRPSTAQAMGYGLERAYKVFGDRPIASVRQSAMQVKGLVELAPSTVEFTYRAVAMVFRAAVIDRIVPSSPCVSVRLPKLDKPKLRPLESAEVQARAAAVPDRARALVLFITGSGLRISEALGVTVDSVDFLRRTLNVDRQLISIEDGKPLFGPTKTKASERVVPLSQSA